MQVNLIGQKEVEEQLKNAERVLLGISSDMQGLVEYTENRIGINARKNVYSYKPVTSNYRRTGRLLGGRGDGRAGGLPSTTKIGTNHFVVEANPQLKGAKQNYAVYVEFGTSRMSARPFVEPSFDEAQKKIDDIVDKMERKLNNG
jgi:HK97 gp10 family phage protein